MSTIGSGGSPEIPRDEFLINRPFKGTGRNRVIPLGFEGAHERFGVKLYNLKGDENLRPDMSQEQLDKALKGKAVRIQTKEGPAYVKVSSLAKRLNISKTEIINSDPAKINEMIAKRTFLGSETVKKANAFVLKELSKPPSERRLLPGRQQLGFPIEDEKEGKTMFSARISRGKRGEEVVHIMPTRLTHEIGKGGTATAFLEEEITHAAKLVIKANVLATVTSTSPKEYIVTEGDLEVGSHTKYTKNIYREFVVLTAFEEEIESQSLEQDEKTRMDEPTYQQRAPHTLMTMQGKFGILTDFIPGGTLFNKIYNREGEKFTKEERVDLGNKIKAGAMKQIHMGIVHTDLTAANVWLDTDPSVKDSPIDPVIADHESDMIFNEKIREKIKDKIDPIGDTLVYTPQYSKADLTLQMSNLMEQIKSARKKDNKELLAYLESAMRKLGSEHMEFNLGITLFENYADGRPKQEGDFIYFYVKMPETCAKFLTAKKGCDASTAGQVQLLLTPVDKRTASIWMSPFLGREGETTMRATFAQQILDAKNEAEKQGNLEPTHPGNMVMQVDKTLRIIQPFTYKHLSVEKQEELSNEGIALETPPLPEAFKSKELEARVETLKSKPKASSAPEQHKIDQALKQEQKEQRDFSYGISMFKVLSGGLHPETLGKDPMEQSTLTRTQRLAALEHLRSLGYDVETVNSVERLLTPSTEESLDQFISQSHSLGEGMQVAAGLLQELIRFEKLESFDSPRAVIEHDKDGKPIPHLEVNPSKVDFSSKYLSSEKLEEFARAQEQLSKAQNEKLRSGDQSDTKELDKAIDQAQKDLVLISNEINRRAIGIMLFEMLGQKFITNPFATTGETFDPEYYKQNRQALVEHAVASGINTDLVVILDDLVMNPEDSISEENLASVLESLAKAQEKI
jgi:hypothetical protein